MTAELIDLPQPSSRLRIFNANDSRDSSPKLQQVIAASWLPLQLFLLIHKYVTIRIRFSDMQDVVSLDIVTSIDHRRTPSGWPKCLILISGDRRQIRILFRSENAQFCERSFLSLTIQLFEPVLLCFRVVLSICLSTGLRYLGHWDDAVLGGISNLRSTVPSNPSGSSVPLESISRRIKNRYSKERAPVSIYRTAYDSMDSVSKCIFSCFYLHYHTCVKSSKLLLCSLAISGTSVLDELPLAWCIFWPPQELGRSWRKSARYYKSTCSMG